MLKKSYSRKKHKTETSYDITTTTYKKNTLKSTENSDACLKQTLDQVSLKQKTSTGSRGNWTTMTNVS